MIREYLRGHVLLTDGAMGTYYSQITGKDAAFSELANDMEPDVVKDIHMEYIEAGARLIRTNTFSANTLALGVSKEDVKRLIVKGYQIALQAARGRNVFVAADIGPIPEMISGKVEVEAPIISDEYRFIIDTFIDLGADIFVLETLSSADYLREVTGYIKSKNSFAFVLVQFATTVDGYTRKGVGIPRIIKEVKSIPFIDAYGFNCGAGPAHLYQNIKTVDFAGDIVSVMPNAGYPEIVHERTVYTQNPEYFSDVMMDVARLGVKILGGCCGTTPLHIDKMREKLAKVTGEKHGTAVASMRKVWRVDAAKNEFHTKLENNEFPIVVELDPPLDWNVDKIIQGAAVLKQNGVDAVTVADSPLARPRLNSMMLAAKIKREVGIDVIPHLCCRDHNVIGLKSLVLAGYAEGIRNLLIVTGDPIPGAEKSALKTVFDVNSFKLMDIVQQMNNELFGGSTYYIGGALNLNVQNRDAEMARMERKIQSGARFFLTQPIFDPEVIEYIAGLKTKKKAKILGGVMPIVSYKNALFLSNEIPGIYIPQFYVERFAPDMDRQEAEDVGVKIAVEIINSIKPYVDGLYLVTPFNRVNMVTRVLKESRL